MRRESTQPLEHARVLSVCCTTVGKKKTTMIKVKWENGGDEVSTCATRQNTLISFFSVFGDQSPEGLDIVGERTRQYIKDNPELFPELSVMAFPKLSVIPELFPKLSVDA